MTPIWKVRLQPGWPSATALPLRAFPKPESNQSNTPSAYLPDTTLTCHINTLGGVSLYIHHPGEAAEGRQQADPLANTEAGQAQALPAASVQAKGRV